MRRSREEEKTEIKEMEKEQTVEWSVEDESKTRFDRLDRLVWWNIRIDWSTGNEDTTRESSTHSDTMEEEDNKIDEIFYTNETWMSQTQRMNQTEGRQTKLQSTKIRWR